MTFVTMWPEIILVRLSLFNSTEGAPQKGELNYIPKCFFFQNYTNILLESQCQLNSLLLVLLPIFYLYQFIYYIYTYFIMDHYIFFS